MGRVLIIGAGGVGTVVAHKVAQNADVFTDIMIASRTKEKCDKIVEAIGNPNIKTAKVDADNVDELVALFNDFKPEMVINVALPYQDLTIMEACLKAGVNYLDTANYEPKDEAHFEYSWQWAYHDRFKEAGLTAILGCGFDPGVSGIYTAYAAKHYFDEIQYLDIVDCNAGNHHKAFATNFNPEINIREITQNGRYYENGKWVNTGKEANRERQESVLYHMYGNGAISYDQYQEALNEKLIFTDSEEYKQAHPESDAEELMDEQKASSWVVDTALREYAAVLMEEYGIDEEEAFKRINTGGYQIYTTVDLEMQKYVEEKYSDLNNLMDAESNSTWVDEDEDGEYEQLYPESAFIAMDYNGNILSIAGGIGVKEKLLIFNRATMAKRQPGSCIKPITTYGLALYSDHIHWGSMYKDSPIKLEGEKWPENYDYVWRGYNMFIFEALRESRNTVPAQLCQELTPQAVFNFATQNLNVDLVDITEEGATDIAYAPLTVGALTYGISPQNLVNAYIPYGNGGTYCDAHIVSRVERGDGSVVYETPFTGGYKKRHWYGSSAFQ